MLVDPSFHRVNRLSVLSFENNSGRPSYKKYLLLVEIKDCIVMIDGWKFFDQPVENNLRTYDNIQKIAIGQKVDYTIDLLLDYIYFKSYKMIAIDLSKQQELNVDLF